MSADWSVWLSLRIAGLATGISVVIGLWLAFLWTDRKWPDALNTLPFQFKALVAAPVFFYCLGGRAGVWPLTQSGAVAAGVFSALPFFLGAARAAFGALDPVYSRAARSLGASDWLLFSRVQAPLTVRQILVAALNALLAVFAELVLVLWFTKRVFQ